MTFSYQCPFVEINEPDLVFCCLYSIGDARIICRFAVFYILFAEFLYPLYIYIYLSLIVVIFFSWYMFICLCGYGRPLDIAEENGCVLSVKDEIARFDIRSSISIPISMIDSGKVCFTFTFNVSFPLNTPTWHIFINIF